MAHYVIPQKFINIIRSSYNNMQCRIIHEGKLTESIDVKTRVKQGCLLSPFLFLLAIDYIMRGSTEGKRNGIQWTITGRLKFRRRYSLHLQYTTTNARNIN
jgi:hypothetical protein